LATLSLIANEFGPSGPNFPFFIPFFYTTQKKGVSLRHPGNPEYLKKLGSQGFLAFARRWPLVGTGMDSAG
jgi:hypothetical protein